ncbi:putative glyoxalase/Bleomycin resistance protein/Dihydroxybiphenyl dioxygenase [Septoria linicola]|nr:putative glyoxalase/Bleomycin resistance protein/Dihydroxybiphenyl dioxygenase [Septoria linicola]
MTSKLTVLITNHTGITVTSLTRSLKFWRDIVGGKVLYQYHFNKPLYSTIVGIEDAVFDIALVAIPGNHTIELLQYSEPGERKVYKPRPRDVGSVHVALEVRGSEEMIRAVAALGWRAMGDEPQVMTRGEGSRWRGPYLRGPDGEVVKLLEKLE